MKISDDMTDDYARGWLEYSLEHGDGDRKECQRAGIETVFASMSPEQLREFASGLITEANQREGYDGHAFEGGYSGMSCVRMVQAADGSGDQCGRGPEAHRREGYGDSETDLYDTPATSWHDDVTAMTDEQRKAFEARSDFPGWDAL